MKYNRLRSFFFSTSIFEFEVDHCMEWLFYEEINSISRLINHFFVKKHTTVVSE